MAASSAGRSRSATTARIERSPEASPLNTGWNMRANRAFESAIRPCLSTVAIAIGVFWKKRMKRTSAARCGSIEPSRARLSTRVRGGPGRAGGVEGALGEEPCRHGGAAARLEVNVETLGLHVARHRRQRGEQRGALARHDVVELEAGGADLREIMVEPIGERGVEIDDIAVGLGRKETGRGMVEIIDGVLQLLKHVLVALEL